LALNSNKSINLFMFSGPFLRSVIFSYVNMTDGPTVDDIVVRYVPENVTSAAEYHLYNEQLFVGNGS
jgi:hypothetical protein